MPDSSSSLPLIKNPPVFERNDPLWFKDAVIYQLHVKAFFDGNNDGIGDFAGLTSKLDYLQELGVTALWLLPFYPSPLRDDGYDISDYRNINPSYGTMRDFKEFVRQCHKRNMRVITELVINHTSDQHPWFQRARLAKPGSAHRDYYVWSDTDQKYQDTRIIFLDTEKSNWTWDPIANAYYWHRFYSHQPDLNFDNPAVMRALMNVLRFWLDMGVDGMRLDAVPYLVEREGTNNENLPETHAILKRIRAEIDSRYTDRMMLAEANQWPEDVLAYFGKGDECHMAFHFPLMPRMYMAIAQEDRHPITDIMRQTPDLPAACQWAIFLRNHDELTLEMVTDRERDYLWNVYAAENRARINLGIRRRLAPLMENDRRKIELMYGLLLSLPGTPVLYYGDEVGMGDNIYLGDRDGVRTPMHWSPDRNAGFSRIAPERLYLPPIMDPTYGYQAVNVEAQARNPSSLLNWARKAIAIRQTQKAFGRGTLQFLYPGNRTILAYLREDESTTILCVFNLSRSAQAVELDLSRFKGRAPVELGGRSLFPPIGDLTYLLTLPGYGFYWFVLAEEANLPSWHIALPEPEPDLMTIVLRDGFGDLLSEPARHQLANEAVPGFMIRQRWFAAKDARITRSDMAFGAVLGPVGAQYGLTAFDVEMSRGESQRYFLPLAMSVDTAIETRGWPLMPFTIARARKGRALGAIYDATASEPFALAVIAAIRTETKLTSGDESIVCHSTGALAELDLPDGISIQRMKVDQSNSSLLVGEHLIVKIYRRLTRGLHPEIEMARFLAQTDFTNTPQLYGTIELIDADNVPSALVLAQGFVRNQGDGWNHSLSYLSRHLDDQKLGATPIDSLADDSQSQHVYEVELFKVLGQRTAELHRALTTETADPAFAPEPIAAIDIKRWKSEAQHQIDAAFAALKRIAGTVPASDGDDAQQLLGRQKECSALIDGLTDKVASAVKIRIHGDYHLGQVLVAQNDWHIVDFEGEPSKSLEHRRSKQSALRDVAGMMRSIDYAAWASIRHIAAMTGSVTDATLQAAMVWRDEMRGTFLDGYRALSQGQAFYPVKEAEALRLLRFFSLEKACYELVYESANRPDWVAVPVKGILAILDASAKKS